MVELAATPLPVDVFTTVHKGLRWWMGRVAAALGSTSFTQAGVEAVLAEAEEFLAALDEHSLQEETLVVPLLVERASDRAVPWQEEHHKLEVLEGATRRQIESIRRFGPSNPSAAALGLALYRTFNRLAAEILRHLDEEETMLMPLLKSVFSDDELRRQMEAFQAQAGDGAERLHHRLAAAYNPVERAQLGI